MSKKRAAKAKAGRGIRNLSAKTLSAKRASGVRGGWAVLQAATGAKPTGGSLSSQGADRLKYMDVKLNEVIITGTT